MHINKQNFEKLKPLEMKNATIIDQVLQSINGGTLIQKVLTDINSQKSHYATKDKFQDIAIGISCFLENDILRSNYYGKKGKGVETMHRSGIKGMKLINQPLSVIRSIHIVPDGDGEKSLGGALRSNGVLISVSGFKDEMKNEYVAWLILNCIERRLNEINMTLGDDRFKYIENKYIAEEKKRLSKFNFTKEEKE